MASSLVNPTIGSEHESELYESIKKRVNEDTEKNTREISKCIYEVPKALRELKKSAYSPRVVSIGPLHKDDNKHLKDMESHKLSYMQSLFCRTSESISDLEIDVADQNMRECAHAMLDKVGSARACYAASLSHYNDVQLAEMMLLDGCFILEFLYKKWLVKNGNKEESVFFDNSLVTLYITHDLILLENQIPFFVLEKLYQLTLEKILNSEHLPIEPKPHYSFKKDRLFRNKSVSPTPGQKNCTAPSLTELVLSYFDNLISITMMSDHKKNSGACAHHILDLLHKCYLPCKEEEPNENPIIQQYSATELQRAGIKFVASKPNRQDVKFHVNSWLYWLEKPRFEIPRLNINNTTEPLLRNLIAFEQCSTQARRYVTSYAFLMDTLINSTKDVELLEKAKVITNTLGASEDASNLFNNICKEVLLGNFIFYKQWQEVHNYRKRSWPKHLASLRRDYFSSPWTFISLIYATFLLILTLVQTIYTTR